MTEIDGASLELLRAQREVKIHVDSGYKISVSNETEDLAWDTFLAEMPTGHYRQTSLWAQVKACLGWRVMRVVVTREEKIVAGAQILIRPLSLVGAIGYIPNGPIVAQGPLFARAEPKLTELVLHELCQLAKRYRIQYLAIQPPTHGEILTLRLPEAGFATTAGEVEPTANVRIDLRQSLDDILAAMAPATCANIRLGLAKGFLFREGTIADLPTYYRLRQVIAPRQAHNFFPEEHFFAMWRALHAHHYVKLFLVEAEGEVISAQCAVTFGNTMLSQASVWSGAYGEHCPNELLQWSVIEWAKSHNFCYYNLEDRAQDAAQLALHDQPRSDALKQSGLSFIRGFGGEVIPVSSVYAYIYNPLLKWAYATFFSKITNLSPPQALLHCI